MTSPLYSELPQELLLDVEPMRPAGAWREARTTALTTEYHAIEEMALLRTTLSVQNPSPPYARVLQ